MNITQEKLEQLQAALNLTRNEAISRLSKIMEQAMYALWADGNVISVTPAGIHFVGLSIPELMKINEFWKEEGGLHPDARRLLEKAVRELRILGDLVTNPELVEQLQGIAEGLDLKLLGEPTAH